MLKISSRTKMETSPFFEEKMDKNNLYSGLFIGVIGKSKKCSEARNLIAICRNWLIYCISFEFLHSIFANRSKTLIESASAGLIKK